MQNSPSVAQQYNQELIQAHREALAALRELLATEKNPVERRRLAIAILKARPVKDEADTTTDSVGATSATRKRPTRLQHQLDSLADPAHPSAAHAGSEADAPIEVRASTTTSAEHTATASSP